jgi:hypothetical protein
MRCIKLVYSLPNFTMPGHMTHQISLCILGTSHYTFVTSHNFSIWNISYLFIGISILSREWNLSVSFFSQSQSDIILLDYIDWGKKGVLIFLNINCHGHDVAQFQLVIMEANAISCGIYKRQSLFCVQWRNQEFCSGGEFNKFSLWQRADRTGIWGW